MFVTALKNTPVFNTREIESVFRSPLPFDNVFLLRQLETILYPGTLFKVIDRQENILCVETENYPSEKSLYIDKRFVSSESNQGLPRISKLPSKKKLIELFETFPKCPYIWGGNVPEGIPELLEYYPPNAPLTPFEFGYRQFKGVDCSGLIFHVTDGYTPRNTSELYSFGTKVNALRPLDFILRKGHVLVVLPGDKVIECREKDGLVISPLTSRLAQIEKEFEVTFMRWFS